MDSRTVEVYETQATAFCARYREQEPVRLYEVLRAFFYPDALTADVGSGSGRDVEWLCRAGFPATGYEPAAAMRMEARLAFPQRDFQDATLPNLAGLPTAQFGNVLCSAVLMHLPREELITAVLSLARVLQPKGRLVLTFRESQGEGEREADGRLFTFIHRSKLTLLLEAAALHVLFTDRQPDSARAGVEWNVLVAEKSAIPAARGLERIQAILAQDKKTATYKLALVRAFCAISRTESELVRWGEGVVYVPLWSIAVRWLEYYWPLVNAGKFIAQRRGEEQGGPKPIAFRRDLQRLQERLGRDGLWAVRRQLDETPEQFRGLIRQIATTIRAGPITYAGSGATPVFAFSRHPGDGIDLGIVASEGWVVVPEAVWLDISRFEHWIEDSIVVRWAALSAEMNPGRTPAEFFPLLLERVGDERDTVEVRTLLQSAPAPLICVWSGEPIRAGSLHVDHVIPHSVWGNNDLWNLLPSLARVNALKSDSLPSPELLERQHADIFCYWSYYQDALAGRFQFQLLRALGSSTASSGWKESALAGLQESVQRLAMSRGLRLWHGP